MKKYLVDTCGWIEWLTHGKLAIDFEPYLKHLTQLVVPTLVQYELYKWVSREKDVNTALEIIAFTEQAHIEPLDSALALAAADVAAQYKLAMADAIIYSSAIKNKVEIITSDAHFKSLAGVKYFKKH